MLRILSDKFRRRYQNEDATTKHVDDGSKKVLIDDRASKGDSDSSSEGSSGSIFSTWYDSDSFSSSSSTSSLDSKLLLSKDEKALFS